MGSITNLNDYILVKVLQFGDQIYTQVENSFIINATIKYLLDSEIQRSTALVIYDLNELNVFMIFAFN